MAVNNDKDFFHCSFCGKSQREVLKLIAGPSVFICNECTKLCAYIMEEEQPGLIFDNAPDTTLVFHNPKMAADFRSNLLTIEENDTASYYALFRLSETIALRSKEEPQDQEDLPDISA